MASRESAGRLGYHRRLRSLEVPFWTGRSVSILASLLQALRDSPGWRPSSLQQPREAFLTAMSCCGATKSAQLLLFPPRKIQIRTHCSTEREEHYRPGRIGQRGRRTCSAGWASWLPPQRTAARTSHLCPTRDRLLRKSFDCIRPAASNPHPRGRSTAVRLIGSQVDEKLCLTRT